MVLCEIFHINSRAGGGGGATIYSQPKPRLQHSHKGAQEGAVAKVGPEVGAFRHGARDDGSGGGHECPLAQEVVPVSVAGGEFAQRKVGGADEWVGGGPVGKRKPGAGPEAMDASKIFYSTGQISRHVRVNDDENQHCRPPAEEALTQTRRSTGSRRTRPSHSSSEYSWCSWYELRQRKAAKDRPSGRRR